MEITMALEYLNGIVPNCYGCTYICIVCTVLNIYRITCADFNIYTSTHFICNITKHIGTTKCVFC